MDPGSSNVPPLLLGTIHAGPNTFSDQGFLKLGEARENV
jgi:hypothetical protein